MYYTLLTSLSEEAFLDFYKRFVPAVLAFLFQLSDNLKKKRENFEAVGISWEHNIGWIQKFRKY